MVKGLVEREVALLDGVLHAREDNAGRGVQEMLAVLGCPLRNLHTHVVEQSDAVRERAEQYLAVRRSLLVTPQNVLLQLLILVLVHFFEQEHNSGLKLVEIDLGDLEDRSLVLLNDSEISGFLGL